MALQVIDNHVHDARGAGLLCFDLSSIEQKTLSMRSIVMVLEMTTPSRGPTHNQQDFRVDLLEISLFE